MQLLKRMIKESFGESNRNNKMTYKIIKGITKGKHVNHSKIALNMEGEATHESKIRSIEEYFTRAGLNCEKAMNMLLSFLPAAGQVTLILDRTNWELGGVSINALVLYAKCGNYSVPINIMMLSNKGGNSSCEDRIKLLEPAVKKLGIERVSVIIGDREFIGCKWIDWLQRQGLGFIMRSRENLVGLQDLLRKAKGSKVASDQVELGELEGREIVCTATVKKLKDEYLIALSTGSLNPLKVYKHRWKIECFFKSIKTAGFNIEGTRMKNFTKLRILFFLVAMAYAVCKVLGIYVHTKIKKIRFIKPIRSYQYSFFRYGLDYIGKLWHCSIRSLNNSLKAALILANNLNLG
jgi:hypothetical protein